MHDAKTANRLTKLAAERILDAQVEAVSKQIQTAIETGSFRIFVESRDMPDTLKEHLQAEGYKVGPAGNYSSTRYLVSWENVEVVSEKEAANGLGALFG